MVKLNIAHLWRKKLEQLPLIDDLQKLPRLAPIFFFKNAALFKAEFLLLTFCSIGASILRFFSLQLLSGILSNVSSLSLSDLFQRSLPLLIGYLAGAELFDFFTRKYGEAFSTIYAQHLTLRFAKTFFQLRSSELFNYSKERLTSLASKYTGHVSQFLSDWFWGASRRITQLIIVIGIIAYQDPRLLLAHIVFVTIMLALSFRFSKEFSLLAHRYADQDIHFGGITGRFSVLLNSVQKLHAGEFAESVWKRELGELYDHFHTLRSFHAKRWVIQLNLFNLLYVGTLFYGVFQIKEGKLSLGYLLLIKYAFDHLWAILVWIIEYYALLAQQNEETKLIVKEFQKITPAGSTLPSKIQLPSSSILSFTNIHLTFHREGGGDAFTLHVHELALSPGERIGIIGESGSGKSSLLLVLGGILVTSKGQVKIGEQILPLNSYYPQNSVFIDTREPLFTLPLRENILLGRVVSEERLKEVLEGFALGGFVDRLEESIGSPRLHLSAGQEQRIRLARGFLVPQELYLLDEPFTGLDYETIQTIKKFIAKELKGRRAVVVTHHPQDLELVTKTYTIRQGALIPYSS